MLTSSAKGKGRRLQQWVVSKLLEKFVHLEVDDITSRSMGAGGEDVMLSPLARKSIPYAIECKNVERLNLWATLTQAEQNANGYIPLIVFKRNRSKVYAVIEFDRLLEMM